MLHKSRGSQVLAPHTRMFFIAYHPKGMAYHTLSAKYATPQPSFVSSRGVMSVTYPTEHMVYGRSYGINRTHGAKLKTTACHQAPPTSTYVDNLRNFHRSWFPSTDWAFYEAPQQF